MSKNACWQRLKLHLTPFHDPLLDPDPHHGKAERIVVQGTTPDWLASSSLSDRWDTTSFRSTSLPPSSLSFPGSASGNQLALKSPNCQNSERLHNLCPTTWKIKGSFNDLEKITFSLQLQTLINVLQGQILWLEY